jgi:hypothetical protein
MCSFSIKKAFTIGSRLGDISLSAIFHNNLDLVIMMKKWFYVRYISLNRYNTGPTKQMERSSHLANEDYNYQKCAGHSM